MKLIKREIEGALIHEPELRYTPSGKALCTFIVQNGPTVEICEAWEAMAEAIIECALPAGKDIKVRGRVSTRVDHATGLRYDIRTVTWWDSAGV